MSPVPVRPGVDAIIVGAGSSRRMDGQDKVSVEIGGRPLIAWTLDAIDAAGVERIVVVVAEGRIEALRPALAAKATRIVAGGPRRHESVAAGLAALAALDEAADVGRDRMLIVHDAARPLVRPELVDAVVAAAAEAGAAIPALPIAETVKKTQDGLVVETVDRSALVAVQTPQAMRRGLLLDAFVRFPPDGPESWTDESALLEACGIAVRVVAGQPDNRKVTVAADLVPIASALSPDRLAFGLGRDSHPFGPGSPLRLGGIEIVGAPRLHGHSDGDVALHAIADGLLGAAGLADLGRQFPADATTPAGIASADLVAAVVERVAQAGWRPLAVDLTIVGARPRLGAHVDVIRDRLAEILAIDPASCSVKASTGNLSADEGAGRTLSATALVTLARR